MVLFAFALSTVLAQVQTDCSIALAKDLSTLTAEVCLAEEQFNQAQATPRGSADWKSRLGLAARLYKRAASLPADDAIKVAIAERLLLIFDEPMLNDPTEMEAAFRDLIVLKPVEVDPLLRYAKFQERQGSLEAAEQTLLSARRLQPAEIEPYRMLAQFYARRASALHATAAKQEVQEQTPPGTPDKNGVYQPGGEITPPRRFGNAVYPPDASAAGIEGAVVAEIMVNESGVVTGARVLKSIPLLDEAALAAVKEWHYDATIVNGKPVPIKMTVTVNFSTRR